MIRFIHAADLHLDRPFEGLADLPATLHEQIKNSLVQALSRLVVHAIEQKVDFVLLAGDIFDDKQHSIHAQKAFIREMTRLDKAGIAVFMIAGNHDYLDPQLNPLPFPENVHLYSGHTEGLLITARSGETVAIYGFSYQQRHINEDRAATYQITDDADYHIALLHGARRTAADMDVYAPFTVDTLRSKGFDYWALGHIHQRGCLSETPPVWYSGSMQGLSVKETGEKGISLVSLDAAGVQIRLLPTASILWLTADVQTNWMKDDLEAVDDLLHTIRDKYRRDQQSVFLNVSLTVHNTNQQSELLESLFSDLIDAANETETDSFPFVWLLAGSLVLQPEWSREDLIMRPNFIGELFRAIEQPGNIAQALAPLLTHRQARKYISEPTEEELETIRRKTEQLLAENLL
ncbi:MAG: DNA repair exonuclease [Sporolactobacillus sp.]